MRNSTWTRHIAALASVGVLTLTGCTTDTTPDEIDQPTQSAITDQPTPTQSRSEHHPSHHHREE